MSQPCRIGGSGSAYSGFQLLHVLAVGVDAFKEVAVQIERHCDPAVPHDRLNAFGGPFEVGDEETRGGVTQQMKVIAMPSGLVCQAAFDKQRHPDVMMNVCRLLGLSGARRKDQLALRAIGLPLP